MRISLSLLFCLFFMMGSAQEYLYFKKKKKAKIIRVVLYQKFQVKVFGDKKWKKGQITYFNDSTIELNSNQVFHLKDIEAVRFGRGGLKFLSGAFQVGGAIFGGVILFNGLINQDSFDQMAAPLGVAAGLYALGWGFEFLSGKAYKLEDWRVEYVNFADLEEK